MVEMSIRVKRGILYCSGIMTSKQRIQAAVAGRFADTTPIMLHNFLLAVKEAGVTHAQYRSRPEITARVHIQAIETYGYDGVLVDIDTVTLAQAVGVPVDLPENAPARSHEGCLDSLDAVADLTPVDLRKHERVMVWVEAVRLLRAHFGDSVYVRGNCEQCPFSLASMMRGTVNWLMELMDDENRPKAHALLEYCTGVTSQFLGLMAEAGADMLSNGDSPAGPDTASPDLYREFALPYEKRIVAASHALGKPYMLHICGNTNAILPDMLETGADSLELDYKTDIHLIRKLLGGKMVLSGNIDPTGVLVFASPQGVAAKTRELLELYRDEPRFILNAGCAIPAETPPENLKAMIRTAREFVR